MAVTPHTCSLAGCDTCEREVWQENADLRQRLEAAERERDEARAQIDGYEDFDVLNDKLNAARATIASLVAAGDGLVYWAEQGCKCRDCEAERGDRLAAWRKAVEGGTE